MGRMKSTETTSLLSLRSIDRGYVNSLCYDTSNEICYICLQISVTYKQNRFAIVVSMEILYYIWKYYTTYLLFVFIGTKEHEVFRFSELLSRMDKKRKKKWKKRKVAKLELGTGVNFAITDTSIMLLIIKLPTDKWDSTERESSLLVFPSFSLCYFYSLPETQLGNWYERTRVAVPSFSTIFHTDEIRNHVYTLNIRVIRYVQNFSALSPVLSSSFSLTDSWNLS